MFGGSLGSVIPAREEDHIYATTRATKVLLTVAGPGYSAKL